MKETTVLSMNKEATNRLKKRQKIKPKQKQQQQGNKVNAGKKSLKLYLEGFNRIVYHKIRLELDKKVKH